MDRRKATAIRRWAPPLRMCESALRKAIDRGSITLGEMCELGKMMERGNYLTVKEAADQLNLTDRQVYNRIYTGDIECVMVAGSIRIDENEIRAYMAAYAWKG